MTYGKKVKEKDLVSAYGSLEDALSYSKYENKKANDLANKALKEIDRQLSQTGKNPTYDATKINSYIESALSEIDKELKKNSGK